MRPSCVPDFVFTRLIDSILAIPYLLPSFSSPLPLRSPSRPLPQGVTHISRVTQYEQDVNDGTPDRWVAHFSHPLELELLSKGAVSASKYPTLLMQVNCCSLWFGFHDEQSE